MRKDYIGAVLIIVSVIIFCLSATNRELEQNSGVKEEPTNEQNMVSGKKAALVDALWVSVPDISFTSELTEKLKEAGFSVDVYEGENVTVNLLSSLDEGYDLVILRMHSAVHSETLGLYLFTAEPYSENKYVNEQYFKLVKEAYAFNYSEPVFAVNWMFVKRCMAEKFCDTTVIVMGCDGACDLKMATEFFNQGAKAYIAWDGLVIPSHSSKAVLQLIENLYIENFSFQQAVKNTNVQVGPDPDTNSTLTLITP